MLMDLRYFCVGWIPKFLFYSRGMATQLFIKRIVQNGVGKGHFICIGVCSNHSSQIYSDHCFPSRKKIMDDKIHIKSRPECIQNISS